MKESVAADIRSIFNAEDLATAQTKLAAISFPAFSAMMRRAEDTKCMSHLKYWSNAIQSYAADHNNQIYWSPDSTIPLGGLG